MTKAFVYGLGVTGTAVLDALVRRGYDVVAADDVVTNERGAAAARLGIDLVEEPTQTRLTDLLAGSDLVVPSPGVPETHRLFAAAANAGVEVISELELAYRWEQDRTGGPRPFLAVTATDGKTTTTMLTAAILQAAGCRAIAAGNTDVPLVEALDQEFDAFVVECSSFRLAATSTFRADAAAWLNLAPDHLNWHRDLDSYVAAKRKIWAHQCERDVAIGWIGDKLVRRELAAAPGRHVTFGAAGADYRVYGEGDDAVLVGPNGTIAAVASMRRRLPHDLTNALAAAALTLESGLATAGDVAAALADFAGQPHRIELVADSNGVRWYNDSKATTPHAAATAIRAFDHLVLIAGGRNKGLDLGEMAAEPSRLRAVVAIGDAAGDIEALFTSAGSAAVPVHRAASMAAAIDVAGASASPGDVVLLSPGCASFDWYRNYEARGDDFRDLVLSRTGAETSS